MVNKRLNSFFNLLSLKETWIFISLLVFLGLGLRFSLFDKQTADYQQFLKIWYDFIKSNGIFYSFQYEFSNYAPLYLHLLSFFTLFSAPALLAVKTLSMIFDFLIAIFAFILVGQKYQNKLLQALAFAAILFAPTVIINGSYWGQSDAVFTALLVISIYFLIKDRSAVSLFFYGVALALKFQAIFISPLFLILFLRKKVPIKYFLLIPLPYILSILPSFLAGRSLKELFLIYFKQAETYSYLTLNAPSLYQWLPQNEFSIFNRAGFIFAVSLIILFIYIIVKTKNNINKEEIIKIAFLFSVLAPFLLPKMHERYFFTADVLSIIYVFYSPRMFFIPIVMQIISFLSYRPYLWGGVANFPLLSLGILSVILVTSVDLFRKLYFQNNVKELGENAI